MAVKEFHGPVWRVIDDLFGELERSFRWFEVTLNYSLRERLMDVFSRVRLT